MAQGSTAGGRLVRQMSDLQSRLAEAEETLNAIRSGAVDALIVRTPRGEQLFTLKGADQTYRALVEAMNEGAVTLKNGIISYCNNHFAEMIRRPMEQIFGASFLDLIQSDEVPRLLRRLQKGLQNQGTSEAFLRAADGLRVPVLLSAARFHSEDQTSIGIVVTDITDRKEVERTRQELSRRIINAQEQERKRVARDLRDSVNQILASAKFRLHNIYGPSRKAIAPAQVRQIRELVERAIDEVRLISRNLRPSELDDLGLVAALRGLTNDFCARCGIRTDFKSEMSSGVARMPGETEMTLYRIAQEALNNVEKHSWATRARLAFTCTPSHASLKIRDNGRGFKLQLVARKKRGWGLENMNERARLAGGALEVRSTAKRGDGNQRPNPIEQLFEKWSQSNAMKAPRKVRVLLADDHALVREGIRSSLARHPLISIVGEASNGREAIRKSKELKPDIVLMDVNMPEMNGLEATPLILKSCPHTKVIALTVHDTKEYVFQLLRSGACGYVMKDTSPEELIRAVESVAKGDAYFSPRVARILQDFVTTADKPPESRGEAISGREKEVLQMIAAGKTSKEVAVQLNLSARTVETYRVRLKRKLNARNLAKMLNHARERRLL